MPVMRRTFAYIRHRFSGLKFVLLITSNFGLGEAFQFDWSEEVLVVGGFSGRYQVAHIRLCASRAFLLVAYPTQGQEMLFDAHTRGFRVLGGVPRRGIYDNMKTAVNRVQKGKARVVNNRFSALCSHYLFDAEFCNVAAGWEKGQVEKQVQDSRRGVWQDARRERFASLDELNGWLESACQHAWHTLPHPEGQGLRIGEMWTRERAYLMPMPPAFDGYIEWVGRVSSTCLVTVERNRYSVPCRYANQRLSVRLYPERIEMSSDEGLVAAHPRSFERDRYFYDWQHYLPLLERKPGALRNGAPFAELPSALQRLRRELLSRPGGDRVMVAVLSCVPRFGLEAVSVVAELVLEAGNTSEEHVRNVLSRLHDPVPVPPIETAWRRTAR